VLGLVLGPGLGLRGRGGALYRGRDGGVEREVLSLKVLVGVGAPQPGLAESLPLGEAVVAVERVRGVRGERLDTELDVRRADEVAMAVHEERHGQRAWLGVGVGVGVGG